MKLDKSYKVRVTPEQSKQIQELVFALGGKWNGGTNWLINETLPFLYVKNNLVMTCDGFHTYHSFVTCENIEIHANDLIALLTELSKSQDEIDTSADSVDAPHVSSPSNDDAPHAKFKAGDKVYCPAMKTGEILTVGKTGVTSTYPLKVCIGATCHAFYDNGLVGSGVQAVFHATQDNRQALEVLHPDIQFEQPPKPLTGSDLCRAMLYRGDFIVNCYMSSHSDDDALRFRTKRMQVVLFGDGLFTDGVKQFQFAVPFDPRTGEPLTEAVLDE